MNPPPPNNPTVALCLETYGNPTGVCVSYERGTAARGRAAREVWRLRCAALGFRVKGVGWGVHGLGFGFAS